MSELLPALAFQPRHLVRSFLLSSRGMSLSGIGAQEAQIPIGAPAALPNEARPCNCEITLILFYVFNALRIATYLPPADSDGSKAIPYTT
jgi:hypothetical protein